MASYRFFQIDVFTDRPLGGNPLAVFLEAHDLDPHRMQAIAREMNLSETTFVLPTSDSNADYQVRIFTPVKEIPFAGHPTLGTAEVLRLLGSLPENRDDLILQMGCGNIRVTWRDGMPYMEQPLATFQKPFPMVYRLGEALGLPQSSIHTWWPAQVVSTGFPALLVPLQALEQVRRVELNLPVLKEILGTVDMIYVFSLETEDPACQVHARGFAPFIGIAEDPATGSVAGALGAYLAAHDVLEGGDYAALGIEQGLEMNRPSRLQVRVQVDGGEIRSIQVGGDSRLVIRGELTL